MGEMRDADWSRETLLRSDWLGLIVAPITTDFDAVINDSNVPKCYSSFQRYIVRTAVIRISLVFTFSFYYFRSPSVH